MSYSAIANSQIDAESFFDTVLAGQYRDNPEAIAQRLSGATAIVGLDEYLGQTTFTTTSAVDLTSIIDGTYNQYRFDVFFTAASGNNALQARLSADNGSSFDTSSHYLSDSTTTGTYWTSVLGGTSVLGLNSYPNWYPRLRIWLTNCYEADYTSIFSEFVYFDGSGVEQIGNGMGWHNQASSYNALRLYPASSATWTGYVNSYGIYKP